MAIPFFNKAKEEEVPVPAKELLPKHVAIIMDGNGRWAKKRGMPRTFGHEKGGKVFKDMSLYCNDIGLDTVSFYAFSTENWKRPKDEVDGLMKFFWEYLNEAEMYFDRRMRLVFAGDKYGFSDKFRYKMEDLEQKSKDFENTTLVLALNYGGRDELKHAAQSLAKQVQQGILLPEDITEDSISANLYTAGLPDVDLVIRPSGEQRLSNFLIWQCAYAEYYFTDILWPDFSHNDLHVALQEFVKRNRRFGGV